MKTKIRNLESYFQMCAVIGIICLISGALPEFQDKRNALHAASVALILPTLVGAFLLRSLKAKIPGAMVHQPHEKEA